MRSMMRISLMLFLMSAMSLNCSHAMGPPDEALLFLAETTADPCSICAKQTQDKAFKIMNDMCIPGFVMESEGKCRWIKADANNDNELSLTCYPSDTLKKSLKEGERLPHMVFKFYTPQNRLVGISDKNYTDTPTADLYHASRAGTVFEGRIRLISYPYGDGPTYNYFQKTNKLLFHCVVLQLKPLAP